MLKITEKLQWDETKPLITEQSQEFQDWYNEKVGFEVNNRDNVVSNDEFGRPYEYVVQKDNLEISLFPQYFVQDNADWGYGYIMIIIKTL